MQTENQIVAQPQILETLAVEICPECKEGQVVPEGRCRKCLLCGWSACSL